MRGYIAKAVSLLNSDISGAIRFSKCFQQAGELADFRQSISDVAFPFSDVKTGVADPFHKEVRWQYIRWYVLGKGDIMRRTMLAELPNGDWGSPRVQFWVEYKLTAADKAKRRVVVVASGCRKCWRLELPAATHRARADKKRVWPISC